MWNNPNKYVVLDNNTPKEQRIMVINLISLSGLDEWISFNRWAIVMLIQWFNTT